MVWGAVIGAGASLAGSILGSNSARKANEANIAASREQMAFQERMRATQYQTAVADMQKAGLNPMLAYSQGGAGTPPGAMAESKPTIDSDIGANMVSSALAVAQLKNQTDQVKSQIRNIDADTANKLSQTDNIVADTALKKAMAGLTSARHTTETYRPQNLISQAKLMDSQSKQIDSLLFDTLAKIRAETAVSASTADQIRSQNVLMKELQNNKYLKDWAPYLLDIFRPGR